jgi:hypothetical protein
MILHEVLMEADPSYRQQRFIIESASREFEARARALAIETVVTIPVVVHVVYNADVQNISDAQVESQMRILNEDYRRTNADVSAVPTPFQPLVADSKIEFQLAVRDPDGNPTNGITRTFTSKSEFGDPFGGTDESVKFSNRGGKDAWPRDRYLNIWVCNYPSLLGYAQFPGGPAETDGVVINYVAFGDIGTAAAPFNKGRTATHEVGHWLNLRHIWGDDNPGSCVGSDEIEDTPNQADANFGSPTFPRITCGNAPNGDLFMNYMDYVDDEAMFMFSTQQVARMRAALEGPRASLHSSDALTPV